MGNFRKLLEEKGLSFLNEGLTWNPNRTEKDFKDRRRQRTKLSEAQFMKTIQKGIKQTNIPIDSNICLYFIHSKFVLVLNTKEMITTTIRDGRWDKPGNNCKSRIIANEYAVKLSVDEINYINEQKYFNLDINENFDLILESKCNYCFKVDL